MPEQMDADEIRAAREADEEWFRRRFLPIAIPVGVLLGMLFIAWIIFGMLRGTLVVAGFLSILGGGVFGFRKLQARRMESVANPVHHASALPHFPPSFVPILGRNETPRTSTRFLLVAAGFAVLLLCGTTVALYLNDWLASGKTNSVAIAEAKPQVPPLKMDEATETPGESVAMPTPPIYQEVEKTTSKQTEVQKTRPGSEPARTTLQKAETLPNARPDPNRNVPCPLCTGGIIYRVTRLARIAYNTRDEAQYAASSQNMSGIGYNGEIDTSRMGWEPVPLDDGRWGLGQGVRKSYCSCPLGQRLKTRDEAAAKAALDQTKCPRCKGRGKIMLQKIVDELVEVPWEDHPTFLWRADRCPACNGTGKKPGAHVANATQPIQQPREATEKVVFISDGTTLRAKAIIKGEKEAILTLTDGSKVNVKNDQILSIKDASAVEKVSDK